MKKDVLGIMESINARAAEHYHTTRKNRRRFPFPGMGIAGCWRSG